MLANPILGPKIQYLRYRFQNPVAARYAHATLAVTAFLSAVVYTFVLLAPFNLLDLQHRRLFDLYRASQSDPQVLLKLVAALIALGVLYWLAWRSALRVRDQRAWWIVVGAASVFGLALLLMYPYDAADIFDNIMHGRIISVYGANPFQATLSQFKSDPLFGYTAWRYTVSAYGPLWEVLSAAAARVAGDGVVANVLVAKGLLGLFFAGSVLMVALILRRIAPERALPGVVLLAWNPIVLYETLGNGHNDIAMMFWVLLATWLLLKRHYSASILALIVGTLFKYIPILLLPVAGLIALRELKSARRRVQFLAVTGFAAAVLIVIAYAPFWHGLDTLTIERRANLFTTSLPAAIEADLRAALPKDQAAKIVSLSAAALTALFAMAMGLRAWRDRSPLSFVRSSFYILMFYLLLTCLWFNQWYAVWPLGLAALLSPGHAARLGAWFGYTAQTKPLIFGPLFLWARPVPPPSVIDPALGPLVMSLAWAYALVMVWSAWRGRRRIATRVMSS